MSMTRKDLVTYVAAVLTTLAETEGWAPEGIVYTALGMDMEKYTIVRDVLLSSGFVTCEMDVLTLTDKGKVLAAKCEAALASRSVGSNG